MRWWRVLGVAGFAGVATTGVLVAREERRRRAYTADEVRQRLHERHEAALLPPCADRHPHHGPAVTGADPG